MIERVGQIMTEDARDKIMVLTLSVMKSVAAGIKDVSDPDERIAVIKKLVYDIRFEADESWYMFVYQGTTNRVMPPKPSMEGTDLGELKDPNGLFLIRELRDAAAKGGGFVEYIFDKPGPCAGLCLWRSLRSVKGRLWNPREATIFLVTAGGFPCRRGLTPPQGRTR